MYTKICREVQLDHTWTPEVTASSSLAFLLHAYLRTPTSLFHLSAADKIWNASIPVNEDGSALDHLKAIETPLCNAVTDKQPAFTLRTDSVEEWAPATSHAESVAIPNEIVCSVTDSRTLSFEVNGDSSAHARFLSQLVHITRQLLSAAASGKSLKDLDLLSAQDCFDLSRWNRQAPTTISSTVQATIQQRLREDPAAHAIEAWDGQLTYKELDALSSRVCSLLLEAGAAQRDCIPLFFEKTLWTVVAMLGVLKSGCSFLLMDAAHPDTRLRQLASEANARIVLSSVAQQDRAANLAAMSIVISEAGLEKVADVEHNIDVPSTAIAAVIFTSGTTGIPKGIQLEHKSICSSLDAIANFTGIDKNTRYFQFSSYAFDAGFGEILMTLMRGGCVCIPSDADRLNSLAAAIRHFNANAILLTPTVVRLLTPEDVPCLRMMMSGGEKVTQDIVNLWADKLNLVIVYGPAETTIACILKKTKVTDDNSIRIGFPLNTRAWVARLDDPTKLAPVGAVGELVAEGPGIARGYINNKNGSSELFLEKPAWSEEWEATVPGMGRSYRTGDLVRYADDGELIFVGRRDRQVKLRGQRIELEEIETKLRQHLQLAGAIIILEVLDMEGIANLVAFLNHPSIKDALMQNTEDDSMPEVLQNEIDGLRERMSGVLPAYMWPVVWIPLAQIPLGPTGKLDRRTLLALGNDFCSKLRSGDAEDEGLSLIESELAGMWREILQSTQGLSAASNFFQLGGDSLRCMKLVKLANQKGYHLTMENVFKVPTLSAMAVAMQQAPVEQAEEAESTILVSASLTAEATELQPVLDEHGTHVDNVASIFPCTSLQAGLFSLSLALPTLYSSQFVFDFASAVDVQKFKSAWDSAINAFPILRTAIVVSSSRLVQVVLKSHTECREIKQDLASFLAADQAVPFQSGELLSRHCYIQDPASDKSHFVWTLHHAVFDGWSLGAVVDHIRSRYDDRADALQCRGSFQEFVQFCERLNLDECAAFWKQQLKNAPTPSFPNFPKAGHLVADKSCLRHTMAFPAAASTTITVLARGAWARLLSEYEGSDNVTFGNSLHGRNSLPSKLRDVVGPTITTLPIRARIDLNQTVADFLEGLQEQFSAMIPYEQYGLSRILGLGPEMKNAASFRSLLIVQVADTASVEEQGIRLDEAVRSLHEYPLVLTLMPGKTDIELVVTFDDAVLSPSQVQRIMEQFDQIFHELTTVPRDTKLGNLDLASQTDKVTMFRWNARHHRAYDVCVHELIRERSLHFKTSPAVYSRDGTMDYATLNKLSDGLAGEFVRRGVKPGDVVGVLFEKSQWAIVSILAVIKAGAAYAPFSIVYPRARLEGIAHDAKIRFVVCSPTQETAFPDPVWQPIVVSKENAHSFQPEPVIYGKTATPDSILYILSTSGTTGTPKIFGVQHKCFATGAIARAPLLKRGSDSRVLQFAPFAFDPSVEDILTTLMFGGCICVPSEDDVMGDMTAFAKESRADFANITPSVAYTLREEELPDFKYLLLSGEAPDRGLVDKWNGRAQVMNGYGPSECSVKCAINCHLTRDDPRNIGHSVGTSIWVVRPENHDHLTPIGAVGELVIESPHLAKGYMNRPEANKSKFIDSPSWLRAFREGEPTLMYKTGDLVRYMEDGTILYIGRGDMQLKLHGQRLEGEDVRQRIQEALGDAQLQVIVDIARFEGQDTDVLVAYVAEKGDYRGGDMDIDAALQQRLAGMKDGIVVQLSVVLPKYMIPSAFLAVTNIPVTSNGKADRRALKAFIAGQRLGSHLLVSAGDTVQAPVTEAEILLHELWRKLLGMKGDMFGASSNFFELGGNSLAAIKLASAARDLGQNLSAQIIFKNPVLSAMAALMVPLANTKKSGPSRYGLLGKIDSSVSELRKSLVLASIDEQVVEDAYPLTRQQQRYMEGELIAPGATTHRHIMQLPADIDPPRLEVALQRVVKANALLRTRVISVSSKLVQVILADDFACRRADALSSVVSMDLKVSWGLGQPLSRFTIVDGERAQNRWLVWSSAHVVFDGWCRKLLLEEVDYVYHHDQAPPARPKFSSFVEHVYDLERSAATEALVKEIEEIDTFSYFSLDGKVPGVTHTLSLGIAFSSTLPPELSYPTVMLTAWAVVAAHVEKHDNFMFNLLLGGRDAALTGIDRLMGPASTTTPLATNIKGGATFREAMAAVQKRIDDAGSVQHLVQLSDSLAQKLASVPVLVVHPPDDHDEAATKNLGLVRSRVEYVQRLVDAAFMNFCLRPSNSGVDLIMTIDAGFFAEEKAVKYMGYLEHVFTRVFAPGGLDKRVDEMGLEGTIIDSCVQVDAEADE